MIENLNPNIDPRIRFQQLPPATIIEGYVAGEPDCNYEIYLLELLNSSPFFREKGKSEFYKPKDESHGQCDAIATEYEIDFKLLSAGSRLQASSLFSPSISKIGSGITAIGGSNKQDGEIKATQIHVAFRTRDLHDLLQLKKDFQKVRKQCIEKDIVKVLSMLEKQKNLLLFFPYIFSTEDEISIQNLDDIIISALNHDFSSLFSYRNFEMKEFDTYFLTIVCKKFYIFKLVDCKLSLIEKIDCSEIPTFIKLKNYHIL
ncbi:hypothetical protein [Streptococcus merionis]|uniref:Uncharacterized protein n=1 Tax=Streptococcus merionis TaxID=400065 RepID=A0A239SSM5_9STRE|nr:hypothetical protein [Streptococcus merionis]SNU88481.1 Uncharacterised protein [Streptococcus merionis]